MQKYFKRHIALTSEHGSWVFLLSPLLIGLFAGRNWSTISFYLFFASLAGFLVRHPITILVKIYSGRRPKREFQAALFWIAVYSVLGFLMVLGLALRGFGYIFYLAIPGVLVFIWHLRLVSQRTERRKIGIEVVASGVLALAAPAGLWIGFGYADNLGWWLWILCWLQSAASIVYAYARLGQRAWEKVPKLAELLAHGRRAILYTSFNLLFVIIMTVSKFLSPWLIVPFLLQWLETLWGTVNPAVGAKPTTIGFRQLAVSTLFTITFILAW
ncbi:MAG: YwiC-like family protein [Chloroflexi bacterium]|nr:YwiC-like family protein [Chloroflexota bacterium]